MDDVALGQPSAPGALKGLELNSTGKSKIAPKDPKQPVQREPGKSVLPFARVQKILKADKELPMCQREAVFAISIAAEEFIKRWSRASCKIAEGDKNRKRVTLKDVKTVARKIDEFMFLNEILSYIPDQPERELKARKPADTSSGPLDKHVKKGGVVFTNEDGTMTMGEIARGDEDVAMEDFEEEEEVLTDGDIGGPGTTDDDGDDLVDEEEDVDDAGSAREKDIGGDVGDVGGDEDSDDDDD